MISLSRVWLHVKLICSYLHTHKQINMSFKVFDLDVFFFLIKSSRVRTHIINVNFGVHIWIRRNMCAWICMRNALFKYIDLLFLTSNLLFLTSNHWFFVFLNRMRAIVHRAKLSWKSLDLFKFEAVEKIITVQK
jgi:hypothetical protein